MWREEEGNLNLPAVGEQNFQMNSSTTAAGGSSAPTPAAGLPKLRLPIFASPLGCHWQCSALLLSPHLMPCALHCSTHRVCPPSPDPLLVIQRSPSAELKYGGVQV